MVVDTEKLEDIQQKLAQQVIMQLPDKTIKTVAGFDVAFFQDKAVCAGVVFDVNTGKILEKKYCVGRAPMRYIPGFLAFREGPLVIQTYYDLEVEPDILMLDGHGVAHPKKCGLATYVGIELQKPTIGVAKNLLVGEIKDAAIIVEGEVRGHLLQTKPYANPLFVSAGHLMDNETAVEIAKKFVCLPHKLPEPLHEAHRFARKTAVKLNGGLPIQEDDVVEESEEERLEREYQVNAGSVV